MIPYTQHKLFRADLEAAADALRSDKLTQGPLVPQFEAAFADRVGAQYAVAVNSGTAALHLAYLVTGIGPGHIVGVPAITFVATANAAKACGADVLFMDVNPLTGLCDSQPPTVGVTYGGQPLDWGHVLDACHGPYVLPLRCRVACFSFHPAKHLACGEGGMLVTNDEPLAAMARAYRDHGRAEGLQVFLGFNYRMPEVQAALGLSQLKYLDRNIANRREIAAMYDEAFRPLEDERFKVVRHDEQSARHLYQILVDDRDMVREMLAARGIGTQVHYPVVYSHPYWVQEGHRPGTCPNAEWFAAREVSLPLFPTMSDDQVGYVIQAVKEVIRGTA